MKTIAIVGAGFAGLRALLTIKDNLPEAKILLFDKKDYFEYTPGLHLGLGNNKKINHIRFSLKKHYPEFIKAEITSINTKTNNIKTKTKTYNYDYLIVATGAKTNFFGNKNLEKFTFPAKNGDEVSSINKKLDHATKVIVAGGGITGVEYASVLASTYPELDITLIHGADRLLERSDKRTSKLAENYLRNKDVHILKESKVIDATKKGVVLENKQEVKSDVTICCVGLAPLKNILDVPLEVDEHLRIKQTANAFACGDTVRTTSAPTAHNAMIEGELAAKHIISLIKEGKLSTGKNYNWTTLAVALGKYYGVITTRHGGKPFVGTGLAKDIVQERILFEFKKRIRLPI